MDNFEHLKAILLEAFCYGKIDIENIALNMVKLLAFKTNLMGKIGEG